jgi:phosphoadenosine phosphosulfate reductase
VTRGERLGDRLAWAVNEYGPVTFGTGFGAEGCVIIDAIATRRLPIDVFTLDTGLLFPETYDLWKRLEERYGLTVRAVRPERTVDEQAADRGPRLWEREPDECCRLRKVEPLERALRGFSGWITAIRRGQSPERADAPEIEWNASHGINKINPLVEWTGDDVWAYVRERDVPYNPLHDESYPSIGCWPCTSPVAPGEDFRAGRWRGVAKTECGIHLVLNPATGKAEAVRDEPGESPRDLHDD